MRQHTVLLVASLRRLRRYLFTYLSYKIFELLFNAFCRVLVKTKVDRALANFGASKNWEDIVPPHPASAESLPEWFHDSCQAGARVRGGVSHHGAKRQFLKALYTSNAYEGTLDAMVFEEAKQNGKFSYLEALCFILPHLVNKDRAKVTKQSIVGEARAVNALQQSGRRQPRGWGNPIEGSVAEVARVVAATWFGITNIAQFKEMGSIPHKDMVHITIRVHLEPGCLFLVRPVP